MRIICPECDSGFEVPDGAIPAKGRKLKCSQCQHKWHQLPVAEQPEPAAADDEPDAVVADDPEAEAEAQSDAPGEADAGSEDQDFSMFGSGQRDPDDDDEFDAPPIAGSRSFGRAKAPSKRARIIAIAAAVCLLVVIPGVLVAARAPLVTAAPAMSPLFDAIGLHVPVPGEALIIQNVGVWNKTEGGVVMLLIQGEIHNDTQMMQSVPVLRGTIEDVSGRPLQSAPFTPEAAILVPGDTLAFRYEIPNPGLNAARVTITFSDEKRQGGFGY
ncbi:MAG: zinc-ribbon domain-containing protein [Proteobacteria bacterium]|nr:zinc-ribbon domain-containing protein [Pseudomonadota bacterium]